MIRFWYYVGSKSRKEKKALVAISPERVVGNKINKSAIKTKLLKNR